MLLITKAIQQAAQKQYPMGAEFEGQMIVAKFFDPCGSWSWYLMNQDPDNTDYLWGIVKGHEIEMGSFLLSELQSIKKPPFNLGIERDRFFTPIPAKELWNKLHKGEHV